MSGKIFVLHKDKTLTDFSQKPYITEDFFQELIERYPDILAGDQITPATPRKWILVAREMRIPSEDGITSFRLDHLFIDQDATPTFVEVKRCTDTRLRRDVVGQMLDYAANAVKHCTKERLIEAYKGNESTTTLLDIGITPEDEEGFWDLADENLRSGKIRLLFVADEIPSELRTIIEYLNGKMSDTEVLGIEIRQYISEVGLTTLVPAIVGRTANSELTKRKTVGSVYKSYEDFLNSVGEPSIRLLYSSLLNGLAEMNIELSLGTKGFSVSVIADNKSHVLFYAFGEDAIKKSEYLSIKTVFGNFRPGDEIIRYYTKELEKLGFFTPTSSDNMRWQLTKDSTLKQLEMFLAVIKNVAQMVLKDATP